MFLIICFDRGAKKWFSYPRSRQLADRGQSTKIVKKTNSQPIGNYYYYHVWVHLCWSSLSEIINLLKNKY